MLNAVWCLLVVGSVMLMTMGGDPDAVTATLVNEAKNALTMAIELAAIVSLWLGIGKVAERSGLAEWLAGFLSPILRPLFPEIPRGHQALSSMAMNLTANGLGLSNAATPFGLKAMEQMQALNRDKKSVSRPMVRFLALNSACLIVVPASTIALRAAMGSTEPSSVVVPTLIVTGASSVAVVLADAVARRVWKERP
ncbi:MAG TPA: nucleoside recognition domain-containing protein [Limnochordia bacterium]|nr:nucleoside recognition domain-containing protein [Limnochordia bacterium]